MPKSTRTVSSSTIVPNDRADRGVAIEQSMRARYEYATWTVFPHNYPQVWMNDIRVTQVHAVRPRDVKSCALTCCVVEYRILELRQGPVNESDRCRESGYSHTFVPSLVDELHRCSLSGDGETSLTHRSSISTLEQSPKARWSMLAGCLQSVFTRISRSWAVTRVRPNSLLPQVDATRASLIFEEC